MTYSQPASAWLRLRPQPHVDLAELVVDKLQWQRQNLVRCASESLVLQTC